MIRMVYYTWMRRREGTNLGCYKMVKMCDFNEFIGHVSYTVLDLKIHIIRQSIQKAL